MERIKYCRVCKSTNIIKVLDLGEQPLANSLPIKSDDKEELHPLSISWCKNCNLVQLNETVEPVDLFSNYVWVTATSRVALSQANKFYNDIIQCVTGLDTSYVLEVASNDGTFLKPFINNGYEVLGIDPAKNIVDSAIKDGIPTRCDFFGIKSAQSIVKDFGQAKVIIARNVLAHVDNLYSFMEGLSICLDSDGLLVVEFHYAKSICEELHYDSIYHEHLCYFTLKSAEYLLNAYGFYVNDIKESPISGGALILYANKKKRESSSVDIYRKSEKESRTNELSNWKDFSQRAYEHRKDLREMLTFVTNREGVITGYGASARSSTLLNFCGIDTNLVVAIADQNPLKQGRYTAGTHIPILSPVDMMKRHPKCILLTGWNFGSEIQGILKDKFRYAGSYIFPLPNNPKYVKGDM